MSADRTIAGFWQEAERQPDRAAVIHAQTGSITFGDLASMTNQIGHAARRAGLGVEDAVAVVMRNRPEYLAVWLATSQCGLHIVPISWHLTAPELQYILDDCDASVLITDQPNAVAAANHTLTRRGRVIALDEAARHGAVSFDDWLSGAPVSRPDNRTAGGRMAYTSGTTGKPKGVRRALTGADPDVAATGGAVRRRADLFDLLHPNGVHLLACPQYHGAPGSSAINALHLGQSVVMAYRWDTEQTLQLMAEHRVTNTYMVPTMFHRLLDLPAAVQAKYDPGNLRSVVHAGARCPVSIKRRMISWWGEIFFDWYGSTEGGVSMVNTKDWLKRPGTVGRPMPGSAVEIRDEDGNELPPGAPGLIYARQTSMEFEYYKDPEKTARAHRDGFFTVGDIGYLDEDGWLFIKDRAADVIISGGVNVYPTEIEEALILHPDVVDAAVVGSPDEEWGEVVTAVLVVRRGVAIDESSILDHCRARLARYKVPRRIVEWGSIPRNEAGKVLKNAVRSELAGTGS